jgi:hydrogenase nickel incorporation protein HypA/HybF
MHEASLVRDLVRRADAVVAAEGAPRATAVTVRRGALCHVSADHLRGHFAGAAVGTRVEGAELRVESDDDATVPGASDLLLVSVTVAE